MRFAEDGMDDNDVQPRTVCHRGCVHAVLRRAVADTTRRPVRSTTLVCPTGSVPNSESEMYLFDPYQKYIQSNNETVLDQGTPINSFPLHYESKQPVLSSQ